MSSLVDLTSVVEREKAAGVTVFVLFCGSQLESGQSWCPDCVKGGLTFSPQINHLMMVSLAVRVCWYRMRVVTRGGNAVVMIALYSYFLAAEPVVTKVAKERPEGVLVHCAVGPRDS